MAKQAYGDSKSKNTKNNYKKGNTSKRSSKKRKDGDAAQDKNYQRNGEDRTVLSECGKENDPSWYNRVNQILKDVTKIPFATQVGTPAPYNRDSDYINPWYAPSVCRLDYAIVPGIAKSATDGVNIAANSLFQLMRKDLSTYAPYASADVMMYVLAVDNLLSMYAYIARMFGIINVYSSLNLTYPDKLLVALGMSGPDITDFRENINDYRSRFNNLIYKASSIYFPLNFSIIDRHVWLFSNYFIDHDNVKAQIYIHNPKMFHVLNETVSDNGTALEPYMLIPVQDAVNIPDMDGLGWEHYTTISMDGLLTMFDYAIEQLRNSDSMNKIAADMRRAFGEVGQFKLSWIDESFTILPTQSTEVMSQIENTTILGVDFYDEDASTDRDALHNSWFVTQSVNKNIVTFNPYIYYNSGSLKGVEPAQIYSEPHLLNAHWNDPSADDIAVMTRNTVFCNLQLVSTTGSAITIDACGSDICVGCEMFADFGGSYNSYPLQYSNDMLYRNPNTGAITGAKVDLLSVWSAFDWSPIVYCSGNQSTSLTTADLWPMVELDNYTFINKNLMKQIHNNIIMSMWSVPQFGLLS